REGMPGDVAWQRTRPDYGSAVVDTEGKARTSTQSTDVDHPGASGPHERMCRRVSRQRTEADDHSAAVDRTRGALISAKRADVDHPSGSRPRSEERRVGKECRSGSSAVP